MKFKKARNQESVIRARTARREQQSARGESDTYRFPWITLRASDPFFIAAIVSWLKLADSRVFTCISSCRRVPASRSSSVSCAFFRLSAAVATTQSPMHNVDVHISHDIVYLYVLTSLPALFVTAFVFALWSSSSTFF